MNTLRTKAVKKFDGGRSTPQEYYRRYAFPPNAKCAGCSNTPSVRAIVMMECKEAIARGLVPAFTGNQEIEAQVAATLLYLQGANGPVAHFRVSTTYCCPRCRPTMERALAKGPSSLVIDIQTGPDATNKVVFGAH